jgi:hypothetical protein
MGFMAETQCQAKTELETSIAGKHYSARMELWIKLKAKTV